MSYPYNPNLSFKPSTVDHYVAFDSSVLTQNDKNEYTIFFESVYRNVISLSVVSAKLPVLSDVDSVILKINDFEILDSCGIQENGNVVSNSSLNNAFALFHYDKSHSENTSQHFTEGDFLPNIKVLITPIAKLGSLHIKWVQPGNQPVFNNENHTLVFKITTCS